VLAASYVVVCSSCKSDRREARPQPTDTSSPYWPRGSAAFREARLASLQVALPTIEGAEYVNDDSLCMVCHETYHKSFQHNVHRGQSCEKCHGPASKHLSTRGKEPGTILSFKILSPPQKSEVCLQCHEQNQCEPGIRWRTSVHAHKGVACTDCHTSHYNVPPNTPSTTIANATSDFHSARLVNHVQDEQPPVDMEKIRRESRNLGAIAPQVCYRCHSDMSQFEDLAHPHQMLGANSFTCATCHDPHGKIREETRTDLCLQCHNQSSPTMAWHSSTHSLYGVACTDCHNPHPHTTPQVVTNVSHTSIARPKRMPMAVDEPNVCFKCHPKTYAEISLPSHHPIKEGKMVCSECHDGHGQAKGNLRETTINQVCYRCHAEKQGPFAYEHPPVTENYAICHNPHGTVANNLLHQPTTFLCLRCHTGHRTGPSGPNHGPLLGDVGTDPRLQRAFYTDCTQCHSQVHGSDVPSPHVSHTFMR
jgi:DmsE family decaheme c-type cytochrome